MKTLAKPTTRSTEDGSVTAMALFVVILVGGLTLAFLQMGVSFNREQARRVDDERALFIAEAGMQESILAMRTGMTGGIGTMAAPARFGDGLLWVETEDVGLLVTRLRSVGMCGSGRVALEGIVFRSSTELFTTALFSNNSFALESTVFVDSFDSTAGTYASQAGATGTGYVGEGAIIQSNGDVVVDPSVEVYGDIYPGQDDTVDVPNSSDVSGSLQPSPVDRPLPPVATPVIPSSGLLLVPPGSVVPSGDHHFSAVDVIAGTLTIQGPARIVMDDFRLRSNTKLVLDSSTGPIEIYGTDDFIVASNSEIVTTSQAATGVSLYLVGGPSQVVELRSNSAFYGVIYCPEGTVDIRSNFEVFGSVMADQLIVNANVKVHFDESLNATPPVNEQYILSSWCVTGLPATNLATSRLDPYSLLGLDPAAMWSPADAYQ